MQIPSREIEQSRCLKSQRNKILNYHSARFLKKGFNIGLNLSVCLNVPLECPESECRQSRAYFTTPNALNLSRSWSVVVSKGILLESQSIYETVQYYRRRNIPKKFSHERKSVFEDWSTRWLCRKYSCILPYKQCSSFLHIAYFLRSSWFFLFNSFLTILVRQIFDQSTTLK